MKKLITVLLAVFLVLGFVACGGKTEENVGVEKTAAAAPASVVSGDIPAAFTGDKKIKIALVKEWGTGTHMTMHINGVKNEAAKYGIEVNVIDANNDLQAMAEGIENAVTQGVDAILTSHGKKDALQASINKALKAGIPVIVFDNDFDIPSDVKPGMLVAMDQYDLMMGLLSQMSLVNYLDGSADVVYNRVANVPPTDKRHRIWEGGILPTYTGIKVLETIDLGTAGVMAKAQTALEAILDADKSGKIDAVYAVWDEYAKGFYNAILSSGKKIPLFSVDMSDQDLAMMQTHPEIWISSSAVDPTVIGIVQVRLAMLAISGQALPRYYSLTPVLVKASDLPTIKERPLSMADLSEFYAGWGSTNEFLEDWMTAIAAAQ
ncbi:MAG: sugar ABC transporter substrate-binding protein [Spirochaetales bacterium]|nr:sugar ABC transporter substrate-binding protein [Spirochaetales bacterium]